MFGQYFAKNVEKVSHLIYNQGYKAFFGGLSLERLKQNRIVSFLVVTLVYVAATVVGAVVYRSLRLEWWLSLLVADGRQSKKDGFCEYKKQTRMLLPIRK